MKEALTILKREKKDALFYFAFMVVSIFVMTFYIHLIFAHPVEGVESNSTLIVNGISLMVICFVVLLSFFASQSLLNKEMRVIAIYKLAGITLEKMMKFLIVQLVYVLLIAFPIGFFSGVIATSLYEFILFHTFTIYFSAEALMSIIFCLAIEVFYLALVSVGFVYKNEVLDLLKFQTIMNREMIQLKVTNFTIPEWSSLLFFTLFYIFFLIQELPETVRMLCGLFLVLFYNTLLTKAFYWLFMKIKNARMHQPQVLLKYSHCYAILKRNKIFVMILAALSFFVIDTSNFFTGVFKTQMMLMFVIALACMLFALVYQINLQINVNMKEFTQLKKLGFSLKQRKEILKNEIYFVYVVILILSLMISIPFGLRMPTFVNQMVLGQVGICYAVGIGIAMLVTLKLAQNKMSADFE